MYLCRTSGRRTSSCPSVSLWPDALVPVYPSYRLEAYSWWRECIIAPQLSYITFVKLSRISKILMFKDSNIYADIYWWRVAILSLSLCVFQILISYDITNIYHMSPHNLCILFAWVWKYIKWDYPEFSLRVHCSKKRIICYPDRTSCKIRTILENNNNDDEPSSNSSN